jgi:SNF2 family DNA or RNA helicase
MVEEVKSDGFDYAIKFTYSKPLHKAVNDFVTVYKGKVCQWGVYNLLGSDNGLGTFWRIFGYPLETNLDLLFDKLVLALAVERRVPNMTVDEWRYMLETAKANPIVGLLASGVRCEIRQMENFSVLFHGAYHKGLAMLIKDRAGTFFHDKLNQHEVLFTSTFGLKQDIMEKLGFNEDQVIIVPGIYRITVDDAGDEHIEEISDSERTDWEVSLARRGGIFDDVDILDEIEAMELDGAVEVDPAFEEVDIAVLTERQRLFLDITQRMKTVPLDAEDFKAFRKRPEKNFAKNLGKFKKYLPTQLTGMEFLACRTSGLLADDMGMGKTVCAVVAAAYLAKKQGKKVAVITNISALESTWCETIKAGFPEDRIALCEWDDDADWVVLNYEKLNVLEARGKEFEVIVFDEAHKVCCPESMRTQRAFSLSHVVPVRFLVTGTPILNTPLDLHTLLRLSGHPIGDIPVKKYMSMMEDMEFKDQIHAVLRTGWLIRRMKADWLKLKPKKRNFEQVQMTAKEAAEFKKLLVRQKGRGAASVQMHAMRSFLADVKARQLLKWIKTLKKDDKVIIFCEYKSSVHDMQEALAKANHSFVTIYGQTNKAERAQAQKDFEEDEKCRFFLGTSKAAGESITLVAANYVYFITLPWTHGGLVQAEDRAWRNGQEREVNVIIPLVAESIDDRQWAIIEGKEEMAVDLFTAKVEDERANMESIMALVLRDE